jgi:hypothetical protein
MKRGISPVELTLRGFVMVRAALFAAAAAFGLMAGTAADASLVSLNFVPYGAGIQPPIFPTGEKPVDLATATGSFSIVSGSLSGAYSAPAYSATTRDPNPYLAVLAGDTATLALGGSYTGVEIYLGSLDTYNTISFSNGLSFTGTQLAAMATGGAVANSNQTGGTSNGLFYFVFSPDEAATSVTFASSSPSLEIAGVSASNTIPEPSTWAMLLIGFAGLGYAAFRRSVRDHSAIKAI